MLIGTAIMPAVLTGRRESSAYLAGRLPVPSRDHRRLLRVRRDRLSDHVLQLAPPGLVKFRFEPAQEQVAVGSEPETGVEPHAVELPNVGDRPLQHLGRLPEPTDQRVGALDLDPFGPRLGRQRVPQRLDLQRAALELDRFGAVLLFGQLLRAGGQHRVHPEPFHPQFERVPAPVRQRNLFVVLLVPRQGAVRPIDQARVVLCVRRGREPALKFGRGRPSNRRA